MGNFCKIYISDHHTYFSVWRGTFSSYICSLEPSQYTAPFFSNSPFNALVTLVTTHYVNPSLISLHLNMIYSLTSRLFLKTEIATVSTERFKFSYNSHSHTMFSMPQAHLNREHLVKAKTSTKKLNLCQFQISEIYNPIS